MKQFKKFTRTVPTLPDVFVVNRNPDVVSFEVLTFCSPEDIFLQVEFVNSDEDDSISLLPYSAAEEGSFLYVEPILRPIPGMEVILIYPN